MKRRFLVTNHPVTYEAEDADRPLEAGMVISVETTMLHPTRGYVKLEDTVAVTPNGYELFGADARGWNPIFIDLRLGLCPNDRI